MGARELPIDFLSRAYQPFGLPLNRTLASKSDGSNCPWIRGGELMRTIEEMIDELSLAIRNRNLEDPSFSYLYHMMHAWEYQPRTESELKAWEHLTHPCQYEALMRYIEAGRNSANPNNYALTLYRLLSEAALRRRLAEKQHVPT
jgi:hypothetical protein